MKKIILALIATIVVTIGFNSCIDDNIGPSISDIGSAIIEDSSFDITGVSVRNKHLRSRSSTQLLGNICADGFGTMTSDVVAQFMPTSKIDTVGVHGGAQWIDSCFITMRVAEGDFTGDSLAPMRMEIYELNHQLPIPIFSDFDPSTYYSKGDLMGSITYSASEAIKKTNTSSSTGATSYYYEIRVPVSVDYARDIFNEYKSDPSVFDTPGNFADFFPGIYITNSYGQGNVMNFYDIEFVTYYRKFGKNDAGNDTIYPARQQSYMAVTPEVIYNNNINLEPDPLIESLIDDGKTIVMGPAGYEVKASFPIQNIIDKFRENTKDALGVINYLSLEIPAEQIPNRYKIAPPKYLLMVKESYRDQFFEKDSLTNNKDAFYAEYNELKKSYTFTGLRDYVLDIINHKGGQATDEDINFIIMPIDVTVFNNTSSYYSYYYPSTTSTQVVTKIAPAISKPCLAMLDLDNAIVKLTYSKQTLY
jgi:hypothetical protein